jgi:oligoendopeptidase F
VRALLCACVAATLAAPAASGAEPFTAIPPDVAPRYRIDFARHYYAGPDAERAARAGYEAELERLEAMRGRVGGSAQALLAAMRTRDRVEIEFLRHYSYLYLRYAVDTTDAASDAQAAELDAEFRERTDFLHRELGEIDPATVARYMAAEPALRPYAYSIESAQRYRPHLLPPATEEALASLAPVTGEWQYDLYSTLVARGPFGTVVTRKGELDVRRQRAAIANDPDRAVRRAGFERYYAGFAVQRDLYAFALLDLARARHALAKLHGFADAASEVYYASDWSRAEVDALLERIAGLADVYRRYQQMRADDVRRRAGYDDVHPWDLTAPPDHPAPRFTIAESTRIIRSALQPLGAEYARELAALLDPANGRMDIVPGPNRKSGGFSRGFPGIATVFYTGGYEGWYNDLRVLTHESTHAIHRQLMKVNGVLPANATGPAYLFESFAIFNELLLPDWLYTHTSDPALRRYYLEQFFDGKGMAMFFVAQDAALEQAIHDGAARGELATADDLDRLNARINARFSIWGDAHTELNGRWMTNGLFYEDPLYEINYVYGGVLALNYYAMLRADPQGFAERYAALMRNGFDAPPATLLQRFLGIDLRDPRLVTNAVAELDRKLEALRAAYAQ